MLKPATEMRPSAILAARDGSGCAFIPVSPAYEWHSWHLPMGTDGIVAETVSRLVAQRVGGIYFPVLSLGLDEVRPRRKLRAWGFAPTDKVFGMNFPELPLSSEYCRVTEMRRVVLNRLHSVREAGFSNAFIVSTHGGTGQTGTLAALARQASSSGFSVEVICPGCFNRVRCPRLLTVGGHAGLSETMLVLAFRPDLVDLSEVPDGELTVRLTGILHDRPVIEERWHPRHADRAVARRVRASIVSNVVKHIRKRLACENANARSAKRRAA